MRRRNLGDEADRQRIKVLLKGKNSGWRQARLIALQMGFNPENESSEIAEIVGVSKPTVNRWFKQYKEEGLDKVLTRGYGIGRPSGLDEEIEEYISKALDSGRWNTAKQAQEELQKHFGKAFGYQTVWTWLKKCAGVLRVPRPVHEKRDPAKSEVFKRTFLGKLLDQPIDGDKPVKIWFADESRYGLLPNLRRVWTKKALRPHKLWKSEYKWSYCYGALDVVDGESVFLQTPTVNLQWTEQFLLQIKKQFPGHEHIVVWDGAGFHPQCSSHERVPEGIYPVALPPYSPELNPIEKLWDLIQDHTSNRLWPMIERLDQVVAMHLNDWIADPIQVIRLVGNGWIRASANGSAAILNIKPF
ncbi:IS630 family transposase [Puniceicoccus vermicola]|uniref:IS630 family transposase n=1 Tax=Puniceicoccus vermicola TaxID=388746 RepID=UPI003395F360